MRVRKIVRAISSVFALTLLGACGTTSMTGKAPWSMEPVMTVRHSTGNNGTESYYALGRHKERQRSFADAIAAYRKAVEIDPGNAAAWDALGTIHARLGNFDEAMRALERAVQLAPEDSRAHNNMGYALLLAKRDEGAAFWLRRAVELDNSNTRAWHNLAEAYRRQGDIKNAELAAATAKNRAPALPRPNLMAAQAPAPERPSMREASGLISRGVSENERPNPPAALVQSGPASRLEKVAENVFVLRNAPVAQPADPAGATSRQAAAPTGKVAPEPPKIADSPRRQARYEISNGHGNTGLARRLATLLGQKDTGAVRLTNQLPFNEPNSVLQYRAGFRNAAEGFAAKLPFQPNLVEVSPKSAMPSDVRLLLGHDLNTSDACAALGLCRNFAAGKVQLAAAMQRTADQKR